MSDAREALPAAEDDAVLRKVRAAVRRAATWTEDGPEYEECVLNDEAVDQVARAALDAAGVNALRAEVERLQERVRLEVNISDRLAAMSADDEAERDEARRALADLRAQYVRKGVCLLCGGAVLDSGEHIDPERHAAEVERIVAGSGEQPGERARCSECGPGYRVGDAGCRHRPAPVVPDSEDVRERVRDVFVNAERRESFGGTDIDALTDAVLAAVGQGVTVEWGVGYGDQHRAALSREYAEEWVADDDAWAPGEERWLVTRQVGPWTRVDSRPSEKEE